MQFSKRIVIPAIAGFCALGGFFLRFFQRKYELLADGSLIEGAFLHTILLILALLFAVSSAILIRKLQTRSTWEELANRKMMPILALIAAAALLFANVVTLFNGVTPTSAYATSAPEFSNFLNQLLPPLGIVSAICIALFSFKCTQGQKPSAVLYMIFSLYLVIRLIVSFQSWNTDPSIHDYCYALLASITSMLAAFHIAGFSFDKGKRRMSLFWIVCTLFFSSVTLADAIYDGNLSEFFINLTLLLTFSFHLDQLLFTPEGSTDEASF